MTGFGRGCASSESKKITVEVKSLNSKQLDLQMRLPSSLRECEVTLRSSVAARLERGKAEVSVSIENILSATQSSVNIPVLKAYKEQILLMSEELGLEAPTDWYAVLLRLPEALHTAPTELDEADMKALHTALDAALQAFVTYRTDEGAKLDIFFRSKIANITTLLAEIEPHETQRVPKLRKRLEEQLEKIESIDYDPGRLEQELIFYIEKLDVNEEKQRLRSHLNYFIETMDATGTAGNGKKLGFIAQEMGREINTLGSKSNNAEMQRIVVKMKDELEQIKEQVLNVL